MSIETTYLIESNLLRVILSSFFFFFFVIAPTSQEPHTQGAKYLQEYIDLATTGLSDSPPHQSDEQKGCWEIVRDSFENLKTKSCQGLDEPSRSLLALLVNSCHYRKAGRSYPSVEDGCIIDLPERSELSSTISQSLGLPFTGEDNTSTANPCQPTQSESKLINYLSLVLSDTPLNISHKTNISKECMRLKLAVVETCTKLMTDSTFNAYLSTLHHIDSICFYMESHRWQEFVQSLIQKSVQILMRIGDVVMLSHKSIESGTQRIAELVESSIETVSSLVELSNATLTHLRFLSSIALSWNWLFRQFTRLFVVIFLTIPDRVRSARIPSVFLIAFYGTSEWIAQITLSALHDKNQTTLSPLLSIQSFNSAFIFLIALLYIRAAWRYRKPHETLLGALSSLESSHSSAVAKLNSKFEMLQNQIANSTTPAFSNVASKIVDFILFSKQRASMSYLTLLDLAALDTNSVDSTYSPSVEDSMSSVGSCEDDRVPESTEEVSLESLSTPRGDYGYCGDFTSTPKISSLFVMDTPQESKIRKSKQNDNNNNNNNNNTDDDDINGTVKMNSNISQICRVSNTKIPKKQFDRHFSGDKKTLLFSSNSEFSSWSSEPDTSF